MKTCKYKIYKKKRENLYIDAGFYRGSEMKYDLIRRCNARRRVGPPPCYGDDAARLIYDTKPLRLWRKKFIRGFLHTIKMRDLNISSFILLPFLYFLSLSGIEFFLNTPP